MANNRQDIDDDSPSSEQPSFDIGKSNFGAESDAELTNAENVASCIAVTKPSEYPIIPDKQKLHVGDEDHKGKKAAARVHSKLVIPGYSDFASDRRRRSSTKTDNKTQKCKALSTTQNNRTGLDEGADGGTSDKTDESNPVTEQQNAGSFNEDIQSKGAAGGKGSENQPSSQRVLSPSQRSPGPLSAVPGIPPTRHLPSPPPASGLGQSEGAVASSLDDDIQSEGAVGGSGSDHQPSPQRILSPSQRSTEPLPPVLSDLPNECSPGIPPTRPLLSPPPASGLGQSEGAVASSLDDDIQSKGAVGGSGTDHQPSSQRVVSPSQRCREQLPLAISDLPNTFPPVPPSPPHDSGLGQNEGAVAGSLHESIQLRPNIVIDSRESPLGDEGSRIVDLKRKAVDWADGRDRPQEPDDASQDHAERITCLHCRQRPADMTLICHCQVLCQECVVQVDQCPRCGADNVGAFRFDS